ncbi:MAG: hypothetical protein LBP70_03370 [Mycoplasmataceae bacterium]|jgi:uncharacterized protein with PQ loop repeat|nr:hypothetical protein [Mycoplasmataceae bacterium]
MMKLSGQQHILWIFIAIGFIGALVLTLAAIINLTKCIKNRSFADVNLNIHLLFMIGNATFFIYALGISIENYNTGLFWNSAPTWIGNFIPLVINAVLVIGKILSNKLKKASK